MKDIIKQCLFSVLRFLLKAFYIFPIKEKQIVLRSTRGAKYNCSPKYISEYFTNNHRGEYKIIWIFNSPEDYLYLEKEGVTLVKSNSVKSVYYLLTSKFIIDNIAPIAYIPHRKGQYFINTWHGGGSYKKGFKWEESIRKQHLVDRMNITDFLISSCRKFTETSMEKWQLEESKILPFGMARNDLYFGDTAEVVSKVKRHFNIDEDTGIILFSPTFRRYKTDIDYHLDYKALIKACEKRFNKKFVFAYKLHAFTENNHTDLTDTDAVNFTSYDDTQELIAAADIIIADYSSLIWDAALAKKPCFIFAPDLETYLDEVGFYTPISEWPFPVSTSNDALCKTVEGFNESDYFSDVKKHLEVMGSFENGTAAKQIYELFEKLSNN